MQSVNSNLIHDYAKITPQYPNPQGAPNGLYVFPEWITADEEKVLCEFLGRGKWSENISSKRLTQHFGYKYNRRGHYNDHSKIAGDWGILQTYSDKLESMFPGIKIGQALANLYTRDTIIGAHTDAETDIVFGISLAGDINMVWSRMMAGDPMKPGLASVPVKIKYEACIPARSLYIMVDDAASMWKHEVPSRKTVKYPDPHPQSPTYRTFIHTLPKGEKYMRASITFRQILE